MTDKPYGCHNRPVPDKITIWKYGGACQYDNKQEDARCSGCVWRPIPLAQEVPDDFYRSQHA